MTSVSLYGSSSLSNNTVGTNSTQSTAPSVSSTATKASSQTETVHLSETARAKLMYSQGESVSTIAKTLGTTSTEIDNDLGITVQEELEQTLQAAVTSSAS